VARGRPHKVALAEHRFEFPWPKAGAVVAGVIDLVEERPGEGDCVLDFKSNVLDQSKLNRLAKDNVQLAMYAWAYEHEFGRAPVVVAIESIETGNRVEVAPSADLLSSVQARLLSMVAGIRDAKFEAKPSVAACSFCPLRRTCRESVA